MGVSFQAITAASGQAYYITWRGADLPLLGVQKIPKSPSTAIWSEETAGTITDTDRSDSSAPALRAYDSLVGLATYHAAATTDDVWYYVLDLGTTVTIDYAAIIGHNFGTIGGVTITLEIANDGAFSSNLKTIATWTTPTTDNRLIELTLKHTGTDALEYSGLQYARLKISKVGTNITPQIGELILGKQYQLQHRPANGFDPTSLHGESEIVRTSGGVVYKTLRYDRRFDLNATLTEKDTNRVNDLINWYKNSGRGFIWIWEPNSAPNTWQFMIRDPDDLDLPSSNWQTRTLRLAAIEQGPEAYFMDQE